MSAALRATVAALLVPGVVVRGGTVALDLGPAVTAVLQDVEQQVQAQLRAVGVDLALQVPELALTTERHLQPAQRPPSDFPRVTRSE